jgi:DNA-binding response OmpR family regulator
VADDRRARARVLFAGGLRLRAAEEAVVLDLGAGLRLRGAGVRVVAMMRTISFAAVRGVPAPPRSLEVAFSVARTLSGVNDGHDRQARVLIVEDDDDIAQVLQRSLRLEGYETRIAGDGETALGTAADFVPDLVVLDLGLPKLDGMDVARRLRAADDVPILMLTARDALESRVEGLDAGADDYLVKPFERQELLARLRALLRRRPPRGSASLVVADLALNPDTHEVRRDDRTIELTQREFELLEYLMRNERIVVPRQRLLEDVWGYDPFATTNTIEVFVSNLRRKLEGGGEPRLLHTIRGAGYVLRA